MIGTSTEISTEIETTEGDETETIATTMTGATTIEEVTAEASRRVQ